MIGILMNNRIGIIENNLGICNNILFVILNKI